MELKIEVKITPNVLFDYMMHHTYTSFSGILGTVAGLFLIICFAKGFGFLYLIFGVVVLCYLPVTLFLRSRSQYLNTPAFKEPLLYTFNDEGVTISQGEVSESQKWEDMVKAISTFSSIVIYTSKVNASIFPKKDLEDKRALLIEAISTHMAPSKVKIRG